MSDGRPPASTRAARSDDLDRLYRIWRGAVEATHRFLSESDLSEIAALVRDQYLPSADLVVATGADDRPLGFMGMTDAHIDALFVDPAVHGRGVGRLLIDHAEGMHGELTVDVNEQNSGGIAFYRRLGFVAIGRSPVDDAGRPYPLIHMRRAVSRARSSASG